jgi:hypothetical protein
MLIGNFEISKEQDGRVWIGFIWRRIGKGVGLV